jgi:hypothetical protein
METAMLAAIIGTALALGLLSGWRLFRKNFLEVSGDIRPNAPPDASPGISPDDPAGPGRNGDPRPRSARRLSVVIPARNEAANLPHLLESLRSQTLRPEEIVVVDDGSEDGTGEIAARYGTKVVRLDNLPRGWTGKNWALWNGFRHTTGDLLVFLDADVRLAPRALEALVAARERTGGVISVVPYHVAPRFREKLALVFNLLGIFAFMSPFEANNARKGLYGSCIVTAREDYERVNGHAGVRSEVLDDLTLGARYAAAGIPVANFLGYGLVSFRMYPGGLRSAIEGFAKSAALSTSILRRETLLLCALWAIGLFMSELFFLPVAHAPGLAACDRIRPVCAATVPPGAVCGDLRRAHAGPPCVARMVFCGRDAVFRLSDLIARPRKLER